MEYLIATILAYVALFLGYGALIYAFIRLRRKAHRTVSIHPVLRVSWWKTIVKCLCVALHAGALAWLIALAHLFAHLTHALNGFCTTHFKPPECRDAALSWRTSYIALIVFGNVALAFILGFTFAESRMTTAPPERLYSLRLLGWSHGILVASWIMCTPLKFSLQSLGLLGADDWISSGLTVAPMAIMAYMVGVSFWMVAVMRTFYGWQRQRGHRSAGEELGTDLGREFVLQDMYP